MLTHLKSKLRTIFFKFFGAREHITLGGMGLLFHTRDRRLVTIAWENIQRVDAWQIDAFSAHLIGIDMWTDDGHYLHTDEREDEYECISRALAKHLQPIDQKSWDYVRSDFFADISRTIYLRGGSQVSSSV